MNNILIAIIHYAFTSSITTTQEEEEEEQEAVIKYLFLGILKRGQNKCWLSPPNYNLWNDPLKAVHHWLAHVADGI